MKKSYECTLDEAVEPGVRLAEMTGQVSRSRWTTLFLAPFTFAVFYLLTSRHEMPVRLIVTTIMTVVVVIATMFTIKNQIRKNIRRIIKKVHGSVGTVPCEYELTEEQLVFRKLGQEVRFSWQTVKNVKMTPTSIEVVVQPTGIALIPRRIFANADELQEWFQYIERHREANNTPDGIRQPADGSPNPSS